MLTDNGDVLYFCQVNHLQTREGKNSELSLETQGK